MVTGIVGGWVVDPMCNHEWMILEWYGMILNDILDGRNPAPTISHVSYGFRVVIAGFLPSVSKDVSAVLTGPDPRKRPSIPPAWNAGPGVKVPKDHRPQGVATLVFWRKNVSFGVFSCSLGLKIKISTWSTWGLWILKQGCLDFLLG